MQTSQICVLADPIARLECLSLLAQISQTPELFAPECLSCWVPTECELCPGHRLHVGCTGSRFEPRQPSACGPLLREASSYPTLAPAEIPELSLLWELPWEHQEPFPLSALLWSLSFPTQHIPRLELQLRPCCCGCRTALLPRTRARGLSCPPKPVLRPGSCLLQDQHSLSTCGILRWAMPRQHCRWPQTSILFPCGSKVPAVQWQEVAA